MHLGALIDTFDMLDIPPFLSHFNDFFHLEIVGFEHDLGFRDIGTLLIFPMQRTILVRCAALEV